MMVGWKFVCSTCIFTICKGLYLHIFWWASFFRIKYWKWNPMSAYVCKWGQMQSMYRRSLRSYWLKITFFIKMKKTKNENLKKWWGEVEFILNGSHRIHFNFHCFEIDWVCEEKVSFVSDILEVSKIEKTSVVGIWIVMNQNVISKIRANSIVYTNGIAWQVNNKFWGRNIVWVR